MPLDARRTLYLPARVNGNLRVAFGYVTPNSYAGLDAFGANLRTLNAAFVPWDAALLVARPLTLAFTLLVNLQIQIEARRHASTRERAAPPLLQSVHTLRVIPFHYAAELIRPQGANVLRLTDNRATRYLLRRFTKTWAPVV